MSTLKKKIIGVVKPWSVGLVKGSSDFDTGHLRRPSPFVDP